MTPLEQRTIDHWREAAADLGFRFVAPFTLEHAGETLRYPGWLPQFSSPYGMLIITVESLDEQQRLMDAARARGFHYSCMSPSDDSYDRDRHRCAQRLGLGILRARAGVVYAVS
jgi:hypothetical protein